MKHLNKTFLYILWIIITLSCKNNSKLLEEKREKFIKDINIQKQLEQRALFLENENEELYKKIYLEDSTNYQVRNNYDETRRVLKEIRLHRYKIIQKFGGYSQDGIFREIKNDTLINRYFLEEKNGERIKSELEEYFRFINGQRINLFPFILDGNEDPLFRKDSNFKNLKFEEIYFKDANLINVLNVLSLLSIEVLSAERMFLVCGNASE